MDRQPRLLYVSPVMPARSGNGLAMRAGMVLRALATRYRVSLLVVSLYAPATADLAPAFEACCAEVRTLSPEDLTASTGASTRRPPSPGRQPRAGPFKRGAEERRTSSLVFRDEPFDVVHVFRLATVPFARRWLAPPGSPPRRHLDLDDVESKTLRRLAALRRLNGAGNAAERDETSAEHAAALEADALARFDRVYVCSALDQALLAGRGRAEVCVLPNALPAPETSPPAEGALPFTFLFVGTLGYYPNEDAVRHLCRDVLPLIRTGVQRPFRVAIVGPGAPPSIRELAALPDVRVVGAVPELAPWYRDAGAIVVPLRAGGGTRIKVLEAFAHRRPVVSTTIGIEGIAARPDVHVLVGDTPAEFAAQCARLMTDRALARQLTERAFALFSRAYTTDAVARIVAALG